jgi:isovaleryl-CoA dehydrogenase
MAPRASLEEVVGRAGEIARSVVAEDAEREDREALWPERSLRALADAGLTRMHVPRAAGGDGLGLEALARVCEVIARESPATAICFGMHCVGTAVIAAKATDWQRERYLEPIAAGEHLTTLSLSEPGSGSHFWLPETAARPDGDALVVDGTKAFVTNGGHSDSYVASVMGVGADLEAGEGSFSCVVLDADSEGLDWQTPWRGLGMRANSSRTVELRGVRIPRGNLLGAPGDQLWYIFEVVAPYFLTAMAGTYLGAAAEAVEIARAHVGSRRYSHSGELLGSDPVVAHRLGSLWLDVERTRQLVYLSTQRGDAGHAEALLPILGAKAAASDSAVHVANEALTLCGGAGYGEYGKLGRLLRDARASHVMAPTTDILKVWMGRALLNLSLV